MAAEGYPSLEKGNSLRQGDRIDMGVDQDQSLVFMAGVKRDTDGSFQTEGGRVLGVTGVGATFSKARAQAYHRLTSIHFQGAKYRQDIGTSINQGGGE